MKIEWNLSSEKKPPVGQRVLVMRRVGGEAVMSRENFGNVDVSGGNRPPWTNEGWSFEGSELPDEAVTHWMELPKAPSLVP